MKVWLQQHRQAARQALWRLFATPLNTLLAALVVGIALALPAGGEMLLKNFQRLALHIAATPQISVFMKLDAAQKDAAAVETLLKEHDGVKAVEFVSGETTLRRFRQSEGLGEVIDSLPRNPFPEAFIVTPRSESPEALEQMRAAFQQYPKVEYVQLDSAWVKRLDAFLRLARLFIMLLAAILGTALIAVTFNTIRLQILTREQEIEVSRLLGATDAFIRRPFYYFGALQGLAGGLVAWWAVLLVTLVLRKPLGELASLYGIEFTLRLLPTTDSILLLVLASALGLAGAWLSLTRHLQ